MLLTLCAAALATVAFARALALSSREDSRCGECEVHQLGG
jgi:hypothetical protein